MANPWTPGRVGDLADNGILIDVDDHNPGAVSVVEPASGRVDGTIIPAAFTSDFNCCQIVVGTSCGALRYGNRRQGNDQN